VAKKVLKRNMHKLKAIIFDMDGLMLDTERLAIPSLRKAGNIVGLNLTDDIIIGMIGLNEDDAYIFMEKYLNRNVPKKEFAEAFYKDYEKTLSTKGAPLKDGVIELIDFLEEEDIKIAVATSTKTDLALKKLQLAGIGDRFKIVVGSDQVNKGKPAPDIYLKTSKILNIHVDNCLALEDSDNGAMSAFASGMKVIVVPDIKLPSSNTEDIAFGVYNSLFEVKEYLQTATQENGINL